MNIANTEKTTVIVESESESKERALADALTKVSKSINRDNQLVFRVKPVNLSIVEAKERKFKEKFLWLFFPRVRKKFFIRLKVDVEIQYIDINDIKFEN
ncbi:DUF4312 family protein [Lactobacillus gigeriorum]|uniref:DUF4312 family protein n=1 Tax=Lactobacillus gigeriorum DSM 23908 = CRBIP 24.85 TaxID=1423751 RepID=I7LF67_9LACO|nr:DUF4312 family protein [Lactobacillus gigeriorum]CCI86393.1 Putative uncharacterized protein [Lactobacillus gigeriorum DSM 23908 = CRBIP 24.85]